MRKIALACVFMGMAGAAVAGGPVEPVMSPAIVEAQTAASGGDNWVGILLTLLVFGTALNAGGGAVLN